MADFEELEKLVAKIQQDLAPNAEVLHNQRLPGRKSGRSRQIDILVKDRVGQYEILIVIDCKDYKKRVDVKSVEEFFGLVDDVGAQKGVLVCPSGFSQAAKTRAQGFQISLYSPVDTAPHKWTVNPMVPTLVDFRSAGISVGVSCSAPAPFTLPMDFQYSKQVTDSGGTGIGSLFATTIQKWNAGKLPIEAGEHKNLDIFGEPTFMENGHGMIVPITPLITTIVKKELFYGLLPITNISGFKDEIEGGIITNGFELGIVDPVEITSSWQIVSKVEECEAPPCFVIQGLVGWDQNEPNEKSVSLWNDQEEFQNLFFGTRPRYPSFEEFTGRTLSPIESLLGKAP